MQAPTGELWSRARAGLIWAIAGTAFVFFNGGDWAEVIAVSTGFFLLGVGNTYLY